MKTEFLIKPDGTVIERDHISGFLFALQIGAQGVDDRSSVSFAAAVRPAGDATEDSGLFSLRSRDCGET